MLKNSDLEKVFNKAYVESVENPSKQELLTEKTKMKCLIYGISF